MADKLTVTSRPDASNNLAFVSKVSGDTIFTIAGDVDELQVGSGAALVAAGPRFGVTTVTDVDAQNNTLTAAQMLAGTVVHTSVTGGGTVTLDTGANIKAAIPQLNTAGRYLDMLYINDGNQTLTLANAASGTTVGNVAQTIATNEAAVLRFVCTADATYVCYIVGA